MPIYSPIEIKNFEQKDKRITFQSIFSSLTQTPKENSPDDLIEAAFAIVEELYKRYPVVVAGDEGMEVIDAGVKL